MEVDRRLPLGDTSRAENIVAACERTYAHARPKTLETLGYARPSFVHVRNDLQHLLHPACEPVAILEPDADDSAL
jgi:hypothetical protein